jgi:protein-L-isoaspartate(D-aspartate) O-methyltransferase
MRVRTVALTLLLVACKSEPKQKPEVKPAPVTAVAPADAASTMPPDEYAEARFAMVEKTLVARDITDERVLAAMKITPRHEFVPPDIRHLSYEDRPLPIGFDLTISQPYIVAFMTQALHVKAGDKILEIGTGSGYQAAVLALMGAKVWTIEIHPELGARTQKVLQKLGFKDVHMKVGDGFFGWPDAAPFDAIMVTCATPDIPAPLRAQLKPGGSIIAPIGDDYGQQLVVTKDLGDGRWDKTPVMDVRFGQMHGEIEKRR